MTRAFRFVSLGVLLLLGGCNPAQRCKATGDCEGMAVCSGGFCTDAAGNAQDGGSRAEATDQDDPGASVVDAGLPEDAGTGDGGLDDGRD